MAFKLGQVAVLKYKVGGISGGGAWITIGNVRDATLGLESGETDVTTRSNNGWEASAPTLRKASIEFEMVWDESDAAFTAIKDAFMGVTPNLIGFQALSGDPGQGLQADCAIMTFSRGEALTEAQKVSVTAKPTYSANAPSWITV